MQAAVSEASEGVKMLTHEVRHPVPYRVECIPPNHHLLLDLPRTEDARIARIATRHPKRIPEGMFLPDVGPNSANRAHFAEFTGEESNGLIIYRSDVPSDLASLRPRNGLMFETKDCLLVTAATSLGYFIAGRACLDSLIQPEGSERSFESVVQGIVTSVENKGTAPADITLTAYFGTNPRITKETAARLHTLELQAKSRLRDRKRWGPNDRIVQEDDGILRASLYHILKAQALMEGIRSITYLKPLPRSGPFAHSEHPNPELRTKQNWVYAYRE